MRNSGITLTNSQAKVLEDIIKKFRVDFRICRKLGEPRLYSVKKENERLIAVLPDNDMILWTDRNNGMHISSYKKTIEALETPTLTGNPRKGVYLGRIKYNVFGVGSCAGYFIERKELENVCLRILPEPQPQASSKFENLNKNYSVIRKVIGHDKKISDKSWQYRINSPLEFYEKTQPSNNGTRID